VAGVVGRAFDLTRQGRPGPVLVDFPKDVQLATRADDGDTSPASVELRQSDAPRVHHQMDKSTSKLPRTALITQAKRPIFYGGGGLINAGPQACETFTNLIRQTGAPCTLTLMGLGAFPASNTQFLRMLGMHGTVEANMAMHNADLVVCVGARFDDRITGILADFCPYAKKIHIDIDPASINKIMRADVALVGD
jgi:acetolactate synthase I/II/III large subunit